MNTSKQDKENSPTYQAFRKIFESQTPEELRAWAKENYPGILEAIREIQQACNKVLSEADTVCELGSWKWAMKQMVLGLVVQNRETGGLHRLHRDELQLCYKTCWPKDHWEKHPIKHPKGMEHKNCRWKLWEGQWPRYYIWTVQDVKHVLVKRLDQYSVSLLEPDGTWFPYMVCWCHDDELSCGNLREISEEDAKKIIDSLPHEKKPKPCPFCGSSNLEIRMLSSAGTVQIECQECKAFGPVKDDEKDAIEVWNQIRREKP